MPETTDRRPEATDAADAETLAMRSLNDHLRRTFAGGRVVMTQGVNALADQTIHRVLKAIRDFDDFTEDNDPYGTHEFGMIDIDGVKWSHFFGQFCSFAKVYVV